MFILSRNHFTSVVSKILENISKFKRVDIEEGKALIHLNQLIHIEEQIMHLFKSLEDQDEISEKEKTIYIHQDLNLEFCVALPKPIRR